MTGFDDDMAAIKAAKKWAKIQKLPYHYSAIVAFTEWLGDPVPFNKDGKAERDKVVDMSKPEIRRKVELINGPNGHTVLKMLEAQKDDI